MNPAAFAELESIYRELDRVAAKLEEEQHSRAGCEQGCANCCVDQLSVSEVEAAYIRSRHADLLTRGSPHAAGVCAFLSPGNGCRIWDDRPYSCRIRSMPRRWRDETPAGELAEFRDSCKKGDLNHALNELPTDVCWYADPLTERLERLAVGAGAGGLHTVRLRALFS